MNGLSENIENWLAFYLSVTEGLTVDNAFTLYNRLRRSKNRPFVKRYYTERVDGRWREIDQKIKAQAKAKAWA